MTSKKRYKVTVEGTEVQSFRWKWVAVLNAKLLSVDNATSRVTVLDTRSEDTVFSGIWFDLPQYVE